MNKASEIVSESVNNEYFATIEVGGMVLTLYTPTINVICKGLKHFARINIKEEYDSLNIFGEIPNNKNHIINGLTAFIMGNSKNMIKRYKVKNKLNKLTIGELKDIWENVLPLIDGKDFFALALSMKSAAEMIAKSN